MAARSHDLRFTRKILTIIWICLLPNSYSRSLHGTPLKTTTSKTIKATQSTNEIINFVDGKCPPTVNSSLPFVKTSCQNLCTTDYDCNGDSKCCRNGCSVICMEPWFPKQVVDWTLTEQFAPNEISRNPQEQESAITLREPCSTSILDGMEPLRCPSQHYCFITMDEDTQSNIPNRGECIRKNQAGEKELKSILIKERKNRPPQNNGCTHKGKRHNHHGKFKRECSGCVCYNGVVFCENKPCTNTTGIPPTLKQLHREPQYSLRDTRTSHRARTTSDVSGSGDKRGLSSSGDITEEPSSLTSIDEEPESGDDREQSGSGCIDGESGCGDAQKQPGTSNEQLGSTQDNKEDFTSYKEKEIKTVRPQAIPTTDFSFGKKSPHTNCLLCDIKKAEVLNKEHKVDQEPKELKNITKAEAKIILKSGKKEDKISRSQKRFNTTENISQEERSFLQSVIHLKPYLSTEDDNERSGNGNEKESGSTEVGHREKDVSSGKTSEMGRK